VRAVPLEEFRDRVPMSAAIAAVERGFRALALGQATLPDPMVVELSRPTAEVHVKGAHLAGARFIVLKVATGFPANRERGLPSGDGLYLLLDAGTGAPVLVLEEHGFLTDLRTAAAIALTLRYLAPADATHALLVGAGGLAAHAARAILAERRIERLTIWNRTPERAQKLAASLERAVEARVAGALEPEVRAHRLIVSVTASTTPLIRADWVAAGTHITSAGTGSPEKVELEPALLKKADRLIADRVVQTERYGNLRHAIEAGLINRRRVTGELGDLVTGRLLGRERADEITLADLTGVGVQDAAIVEPVVEALGL
jgi:ornithine cyclodeaminase/alanine dehydrogenase-like protein (mu-crystallin family)